MKNQIKSLLLVAFMLGTVIPAWGQASTQGKEFWVSSTLVCSPDKATPTPYIAISAEKACTVTITGGVGNAINITQQVNAGSWNEFGNDSKDDRGNQIKPYNTNPSQGLINVQMDASKWYPTTMKDANNVSTLAGQKNMYGLHITATEPVSVYVILASKHSMDASNILPTTAIGSEYYTQDYWSKVKSDFNDAVGLTTILGTEDNTTIDITPNGDTFDGHPSGQLYTITLNRGQTYYMVTKKGDRLAGTHIKANNGKKIAVYCGVPITNIPTGIAARDCLFEQPMPVEYWGTQFIVSRSLEKNGNFIGITAMTNGTEIKVDGYTQGYINEGETYIILLQGPSNAAARDTATSHRDLVITQDVAYIETSCPSAVYNYDSGNSFKGSSSSDPDEIVNGHGDPSSVWVSPIQQKINKITFGTCYTDKTKDHFLNVVTETATCQNTKLTALYGANQLDKSNLLVWTPVTGNPKYSYARAKIGDADSKNYSVFRLENSKGFTAMVYGNGEDESYAYSAGSAAVEQGVSVNGETFTNGYRSDSKFCMADVVEFDAGIGTDEITRVDWNFGDGTSEEYSTPYIEHQYLSPGWYDVTAYLYGHQVCTNENEMFLGDVHFSFRVVQQDTLMGTAEYHCLPVDTLLDDPERRAYLLEHGENKIITPEYCYEPVYINYVLYGENADTTITVEGQDSVKVNGETYSLTQDINYVIPNPKYPKCDMNVNCHIHIIQCLNLSVTNDPNAQHICPGDPLPVTYSKSKGDIDGVARLVIPGLLNEAVYIDNANVGSASLSLPTYSIQKPGIYQAQLIVPDLYCDTLKFPIDFTVYYPSDIFKLKFNNVLAVFNKDFNGGYDFEHYEWHLIRNGQDTIIGGDQSVYHQDEPFEENDVVYVVLTDKTGFSLRSCEQEWENVQPMDDQQNNAPATYKVIRNQKMYIRIGDRIYDMYGQRVE